MDVYQHRVNAGLGDDSRALAVPRDPIPLPVSSGGCNASGTW